MQLTARLMASIFWIRWWVTPSQTTAMESLHYGVMGWLATSVPSVEMMASVLARRSGLIARVKQSARHIPMLSHHLEQHSGVTEPSLTLALWEAALGLQQLLVIQET